MSKLSFEEQKERLKDFCLMDDALMRKVFEKNIKAAELLLRIILKRDNLSVTNVKTQYSIRNSDKRGIKLDIYALDENGKVFNVEVQRSNSGAHPKRARYHSSLIDANISIKNMEFKDLPETYVIFITENDVLQCGAPIYHVNRVIEEYSKPFNDEAHIIYVNSKVQNNTALGKLMQDFYCKDSKNMHYDVLAEKVHYYKETKKGVSTMITATDKLMAKGRAEGREEMRQTMLAKEIVSIKSLMDSLKVSAKEAMTLLKYPESEQKQLMTML